MTRKCDGHYYAKDGTVWKAPVETVNDDGSRNISIGFPVCTMHRIVGLEAAEIVARLMNAGAAALGDEAEPDAARPRRVYGE